MIFRPFLPLALVALAAPAFGQAAKQGKAIPRATAVQPATPAADKPLTEADLMKKLDELKVGDPIKAQPASAPGTPLGQPNLPTLKAPGAQAKPGAAPGTPGAKEQDQTEITAEEATFDSKTHQAVFLKHVVVVNPQFTVTADKVTAFMKQSDNPAIPGAPAASGTPAATPSPGTKADGPAAGAKSAKKGGASNGEAGGDKGKSGGLERAIAEGNVVITQDKTDEDGNVTHSVGHGRKAVYEASTGDITLTGHPDVAQGINSLEATADETVIILNREGRMKAIGPHKTTIRDSGSDADNPLTGGSSKTKTSSATTITTTPNAR